MKLTFVYTQKVTAEEIGPELTDAIKSVKTVSVRIEQTYEFDDPNDHNAVIDHFREASGLGTDEYTVIEE